MNYMKRCSVRVRRCLSSPTDVRSSPSFRRKRHADLTKVEEVEATKHEDSAGDAVNSPCKKRARLSVCIEIFSSLFLKVSFHASTSRTTTLKYFLTMINNCQRGVF